MKGFKKDGKFIPTGNRKKSSLSKADVKPRELEIKKYIPIDERKKNTFGDYEVDCDCKGKDKNCKKCNGKGSNTWTSQVGNKKTLDRDKQTIGSHAGHPLVLEDNGKIYEEFDDHHEEVYKQPNAKDHHRNKETLDEDTPIYLNGNMYKVTGKPKEGEIFPQMEKIDTDKRSKFSLFGSKKDEQAKNSEDRIKQEEHNAKESEKQEEHENKVLEKQDETQDKNNKKRAVEIAKHIKFLEKHMEGLEKKPAKFGVNANTQLETLQESRDQKRDLQAELDEINKLLEKPIIRHKKGIDKFTNHDYREQLADISDNPSAKEYTGRDKRTISDTDEMKNLIHENQISSKPHDSDKRMKKSIDEKKYRIDSPTGSFKMVTHDELVKILKKDAEADKKYGRK